jgi:hypothetical protein
MRSGDFHLRDLAASLGQSFKSARWAPNGRGDLQSLATAPFWLFQVVWMRPKALVAEYLDLWNWDSADP